jgi:epoxyqueuosine reductase
VPLTQQLHDLAHRLGADRTGVCTADVFAEMASSLHDRIRSGLHGGLGFTFKDPDRSTAIRSSFPWAERLFVVGRAYVPEAGSPGPPDTGSVRVARFATDDHYEPLRACLDGVAAKLEESGHRAETLADDDRLVDRAAAVRAGLGWWGKNTMVLAPDVGPWMLLGSVVTDAPLEVDPPMVRTCGTCSACIPACPTGALDREGILDATKCLAAVLQRPGVIPRRLRPAVGDRLYGCDDCLDVCPPGLRRLETGGANGRHDIVGLLALDDVTLLRRFGHFYIPKRRAGILRRNALVALGNVGTSDDIPLLAGFLGHPVEILRLHAAWALGRVGGDLAVAALEAARSVERTSEIHREIDLALIDARVRR